MFENNTIDILSEKPMDGMEHYAQGFLDDRFAELADLKIFVRNSDISSIAGLVHKWKGFSAPYGFQTLGELSSQLSDDIKNSHPYDLPQFVKRVEDYLQIKKEQLNLV